MPSATIFAAESYIQSEVNFLYAQSSNGNICLKLKVYLNSDKPFLHVVTFEG